MNSPSISLPVRLLVLLGCVLLGLFLFSILSTVAALALGFSIDEFATLSAPPYDRLNALKLFQAASSIGIFVLPAVLFSLWRTRHPFRYFTRLGSNITTDNSTSWRGSVLAVFVVLSSFPVMAYLLQWNQQIALPSGLSNLENWMRLQEAQMQELTVAFLQMDSPLDFFINLIVIAVLPAVGEEIFFRGTLQKTLSRSWGKHLAIWTTAVVFSAIHLQFLGFFPRMMIGVYLGYLFVWSGSLWFPVLAHFVNNGFQVLTVWLGWVELDSVADAPAGLVSPWLALLSLTVLYWILLRFKTLFSSRTDE